MKIVESYEVLGIPITASGEEVDKAFHNGAFLKHPDRGGNAEDFKKLVEAYNFVKSLKDCVACDGKGECFLGITPFMIIVKCGYCHGTGKYEQK